MSNPDHRPVFICAGSCNDGLEACDLMLWQNCDLYCEDCRNEKIDDGDMLAEDFTKFVPDHVTRIAELVAENAALESTISEHDFSTKLVTGQSAFLNKENRLLKLEVESWKNSILNLEHTTACHYHPDEYDDDILLLADKVRNVDGASPMEGE